MHQRNLHQEQLTLVLYLSTLLLQFKQILLNITNSTVSACANDVNDSDSERELSAYYAFAVVTIVKYYHRAVTASERIQRVLRHYTIITCSFV